MDDRVSIAPLRNVIVGLSAQGIPMRTVLGELLDNALDAGAQHVAITFDRNAFIVEDDGKGTDSPIKIVRLGDRSDHATTKLGRFGIGAKDAILSLGGAVGSVTVRSVCGGMERTVEVEWAKVGDDWKIPRPTEMAAEPGARGTRIVVSPCRRPPHGEAWRELVDEIGYLYSPAIKRGAQVALASTTTKGKLEPAPRWALPRFEEGHVETDIVVGGRKAHVYAGVVAAGEDNPNPRSGLTYWHGFRVILPSSPRGCGGYSVGKVCGVVELVSGWALSKNKTAIVAAEEDLFSAVEEAIMPVLKRAEQASAILGCEEFQTKVSGQLNALLAGLPDAKAKRGKGEDEGTKTPTGKGKKHKGAAKEQKGGTFKGRGGGAFRVEHAHLGGDVLGEVKGAAVLLNLDNAFVAHVQRGQNVEAGVALAVSLIGDVARTEGASGQRILRTFETDSLPKAMGKILASLPSVDGRPILRALPGVA